jgi:Bacterial low temperature requirement A protein (LtrA)
MLPWAFVWALAHYLIFAAVAALGAGLQVTIGTLTHSTRITPSFAAFTVAIPVTVYIAVLALLSTRSGSGPAALWLTLLTSAVILAAAAATPALTLPLSTVIMVVLVALLLAYHLAAAHRATPQP